MKAINNRWILPFLLTFSVVIFIYSLLFGSKVGRGDEVPSFTVISLDGESVSNSNFPRGPYLIHFWARWCDRCIGEIEGLKGLQKLLGNKLFIATIHIGDSLQDALALKEMRKEMDINYNIYLDNGEVGKVFGVREVPVSFLVDRNGVIVKKLWGSERWTSKKIVNLVERLIYGGASGVGNKAK